MVQTQLTPEQEDEIRRTYALRRGFFSAIEADMRRSKSPVYALPIRRFCDREGLEFKTSADLVSDVARELYSKGERDYQKIVDAVTRIAGPYVAIASEHIIKTVNSLGFKDIRGMGGLIRKPNKLLSSRAIASRKAQRHYVEERY